MKVGEWHIRVESVEDWTEEKGYVLIWGRVQEDNTAVEFYTYPEEGYVSAYELQEGGPDLDWPLSGEEQEDVLRFVEGWLIAREALERGSLPEALEFPAPDWENYARFGADHDGGNYATIVKPIEHYNPVKDRVEYYIISYSTREIGDMDVLVTDKESGELISLPREWAEHEGYQPGEDFTGLDVYADLEVYGPFDREEFAVAWAEWYQGWYQQREAFEEWKASHGF